MFRKLHFRLTAYNALILIIFMIIFSIIVYSFMSKLIFGRADEMLRNAAYRVDSLDKIPSYFQRKELKKDPEEFQPKDKFLEKLFDIRDDQTKYLMEINYILRDQELEVKTTTVEDESILSMTYRYAQKLGEERWSSYTNLDTNEGKLRLLTIPLNKNGQKGIVQVYTRINREIAFLSSLMTTLILLGVINVLVLVTIGWFLAGKSLVPIKKSWQQQKNFVADASHELRTPLTVMQTNLEILLANQEEKIADNLKWINNIHAETEMMAKLIKDLLFLAQIDANHIQLEKSLFNLSQTAANTVQEFATMLKSKNLSLESNIQGEIKFIGDELRIKQLLHILLDNAYKYTPEGGKITFTLSSYGENIYIVVKDTGIGISDQDKEYIFERFYRADKARSRQNGGTGLGLSIAKWIVNQHNGKIEVKSKLDEGTEFLLTFGMCNLK